MKNEITKKRERKGLVLIYCNMVVNRGSDNGGRDNSMSLVYQQMISKIRFVKSIEMALPIVQIVISERNLCFRFQQLCCEREESF